MKIVNLSYKVWGVLDTPTSVLSQRMEYLGHDICLYNGFYFHKKVEQVDWVAAYHENVNDWDLLLQIKNKFGCKTYIHLEWLMPWIYDIDYFPMDWGYRNKINNRAIQEFKNRSHIWESADIRTCASKHFIKPLQKFFNSDKEIFVKKPGADEILAGYIEHNLAENRTYDIVTISRFEPHKKIDMIAKGLSLCKRKIKWLLCGNGTEHDKIFKIINDSGNIECSYVPMINGFDKFKAMSFAKVSIHAWSGMSSIDGVLMDCFPLFWNNPYHNEYFSGLGESFENDLDLADKVNKILDDYNKYFEITKNNKENILSCNYGFGTVTQEAKLVLDKMQNEQ